MVSGASVATVLSAYGKRYLPAARARMRSARGHMSPVSPTGDTPKGMS